MALLAGAPSSGGVLTLIGMKSRRSLDANLSVLRRPIDDALYAALLAEALGTIGAADATGHSTRLLPGAFGSGGRHNMNVALNFDAS